LILLPATDKEYDSYFEKMTDDAILSVLMRQNWRKPFQAFYKPYLIEERQVLHWNAIFISINEWLGLTNC
jgi:hypothetical protein